MKNISYKAAIAAASILAIFLCSSCTTTTLDSKPTDAKIIERNTEEPSSMEVISEEPWSWTLFQSNHSYYLTVVCGSVGIFNRNLELTKEEVFEYKAKGTPYINILASQIRKSPHIFEKRHLHSFENMQVVKNAQAKWRKK